MRKESLRNLTPTGYIKGKQGVVGIRVRTDSKTRTTTAKRVGKVFKKII